MATAGHAYNIAPVCDRYDTWYSASLWANPITEALRYGTHFQRIRQFYLPPRVYPRMEWIIPAFAFPVEAGPYLRTPEGGKAELA